MILAPQPEHYPGMGNVKYSSRSVYHIHFVGHTIHRSFLKYWTGRNNTHHRQGGPTSTLSDDYRIGAHTRRVGEGSQGWKFLVSKK